MDISYRSVVIETLKKIFKDKSYSNLVINYDIKNIEKKHYGIYRKSVLGVIENLIFIDWIINQVSKTKVKKMEYDVLIVLRVAVYQLFFLDNSFENIIVNESVQYIKDKGNIRASKFINAVLRNIIRYRDKILRTLENLPYEDYLSIKYSYPKWLVEKWTNEFGKDEIERVLRANNSEAPMEIRVNTLKISRDELLNIFSEEGIEAYKSNLVDKCIIIKNPIEIDKTQEYKDGFFSIQSESSMLAGQVLNPKKNSFVIDLCGAPGGKSLNAAELMNNTGNILTRDIYSNKLSLIRKESERLGINTITAEKYDAQILDETLTEKADYCIVDVPCTGLGIIRRKPEIKYNKIESDIGDIQKIQYMILENASKYLKINGELVYSTCTVNKEENLDVINKFIRRNRNFELMDISHETHDNFSTSKNGYIEIYPHLHHMDGFFIAKLKRV